MSDEEPTQGVDVLMGLDIEWRNEGPEPTAMAHVPLGGPEPVAIITIDFSPPNLAAVHVNASGFPSHEALSELFRAIAEHMETSASTIISPDGVEYRQAPRKDGDT